MTVTKFTMTRDKIINTCVTAKVSDSENNSDYVKSDVSVERICELVCVCEYFKTIF